MAAQVYSSYNPPTRVLFLPIDIDDVPKTVGVSEVHLWSVDVSAESWRRVLPLLSEDEQDRARRYAAEMDSARFVVARAALRTLAGRYLQTAATSVEFDYGRHGKPHLREIGGRQLHVSVSHSGQLALLAFCATEEVGVDVERVRDVDDAEQIARRFFSPEESVRWLGLRMDRRRRAFFDIWTRREAYLKALGLGVAAAALHVPDSHDQEWSILDVSPSSAYAAALAIRGGGWDVRSWTLAPRASDV